MNRSHSLVALLAVVPVIAACGSASSSPSATKAPTQPTATTATANPAALVLHLPDLGYGYIAVAKDTKKISLAEELKSDSAVSKPADRAGYRGGYRALFGDANEGGVLSEALEYNNDSSAATVYNDVTGLNRIAAQLHGSRITIPAHAPGINQILVKGKTLVAGHMRTAYLISWRHGSVLSLLFTFGQNATQSRLIALANHQDNRITATGM
jgi:hypothetical protein